MLFVRAACLVILALVALPAAQASLTAEARTIDLAGGLDAGGDLQGLLVAPGTAAIGSLLLEAQQGQMVRWTQEGAFGPCAINVCPQQSFPIDEEPQHLPAEGPAKDLQMTLSALDAHHVLAIVPLGPVSFQFQGTGLSLQSMPSACMTELGFTGPQPDCAEHDSQIPGFSKLALDMPIQLATTHKGGVLTLSGTMALEMRGVDLVGDGLHFATREARSGGSVGTFERSFGRVVLTEAIVTITLPSGAEAEWATLEAATLAHSGVALLREARGVVTFPVERPLDPSDKITGDFRLDSSAREDSIGFATLSPDGIAVPASMPVPAPIPSMLAAIAMLVPLAGVALIIHRHRAHTSLRHVEAALHKGRYGRADRLSRRILRYDPLHESAHLSRAIALTRAGRPAAAVAGIQGFLQQHEPQDGTLHYALGVALLDLGQQDAAREALHVAVERTPALRQELASDLRPLEDGAYT